MTEENLAGKNPAFSFCLSGKFRFGKSGKSGIVHGRNGVFEYAEILERRNGNFQKSGKIEKHMRENPIFENVLLTGRNDARFILAVLPEEMRFSKHGNSGGRADRKNPFSKTFHSWRSSTRNYRFSISGKSGRTRAGKSHFQIRG